MTALAIIIGLAVLVFFLVQYPKKTLQIGCAAAALLVCGVVAMWYFFEARPNRILTERLEKVLVAVRYAPETCTAEAPLSVAIKNTGRETVAKITWSIQVFRPGYSSNIAEYSSGYSSDRILARGESFQMCVPVPSLNSDARLLDRAGLTYEVYGKWVEWVE